MRQPNPPGYVRRGDVLMKIWTDCEKQFIRDNPKMPVAQMANSPELAGRTVDAISKMRVALGVTDGRSKKGAAKRIRTKRYDKPADSYVEPAPRYPSIFHMAQGVQV